MVVNPTNQYKIVSIGLCEFNSVGEKMAVVGGDSAKLSMETSFNFLTLFLHHYRNEPHQINFLVRHLVWQRKVSLKFTDKLKSNPDVDKAHLQPYLEVEVDFYRDKIIYQYEGCVTAIEDVELVHYFYMLMREMAFPWMFMVYNNLFTPECPSLKSRCKEALCKYKSPGGSVLRHMLTSAQVLAHELCEKGRFSNVEEVKSEYIQGRLGKGLLKSAVTINRDNLYSFHLPLHGKESLVGRVELLGHLLLIEAVLMSDHHQWEEVYADCFHCQVEGFHFYLWRECYPTVIEYYIFFDLHMWKLMLPFGVRTPRCSIVNGYTGMHQFEINWRHHFLEDFLFPYFFQHRDLEVKSLQQLAGDMCVSNVVMARFEILYSLGLDSVDLEVEFPEQDHHLGPFILYFLPVMAYVKDTYEELMKKDHYVVKGVEYNFPPVEDNGYLPILNKALKYPLSHHLSLLRISTNFLNNHYSRMKHILQLAAY